jgi:hypothetical protein
LRFRQPAGEANESVIGLLDDLDPAFHEVSWTARVLP